MKLFCAGKIKDRNIESLIAEYKKRITLEVLEIKDSLPLDEGKKFIELVSKLKSHYIVCLSEEGKLLSSVEFASFIKKQRDDGKDIAFIIGGPDGLSDEIKKKSDIIISLSRMTFTHEMARLFLIEQIYRAESILQNKNYHR